MLQFRIYLFIIYIFMTFFIKKQKNAIKLLFKEWQQCGRQKRFCQMS